MIETDETLIFDQGYPENCIATFETLIFDQAFQEKASTPAKQTELNAK